MAVEKPPVSRTAYLVAAGLLVALALPASSHAQSGVVEGTVFDSVGSTRLPGALVQVRQRDAEHTVTGTADSTGRFRLSGLHEGTWAATFFHPALDSLGIEAPVREVRVTDGSVARLSLAIPSARTIVTALCGTGAVSDTTGTLMGFVRDATTLAGAAQATVTVQWTSFRVDEKQVRLETPETTVPARDNGWFALCNVPVGWTVQLLAESGTQQSGIVEARATARQIERLDLFVGPGSAVPTPREAGDSTPLIALHRGEATLAVRVVTANGEPVTGARVSVAGTGATATSSSSGLATLTDLPAGSWMLDTRAVGYVPERSPVHLLVGDVVNHAEVALTSRATYLDTVRVTAQRVFDRDVNGFQRRRRTGLGDFFTREDIDRRNPAVTTDLLVGMTSLQVQRTGLDTRIFMRGTSGGVCRPVLYLDGVRFAAEEADLDLLTLPDELEGIEVYSRSLQTPGMFADLGGGCGTIVIWTRRRWADTPRR